MNRRNFLVLAGACSLAFILPFNLKAETAGNFMEGLGFEMIQRVQIPIPPTETSVWKHKSGSVYITIMIREKPTIPLYSGWAGSPQQTIAWITSPQKDLPGEMKSLYSDSQEEFKAKLIKILKELGIK